MFEVLGYIFAAIVIIYAVVHAGMAIANVFRDEDNPLEDVSITNGVYCDTYMSDWYILPTIRLMFGSWYCITFSWLLFHWEISFHIRSREEIDKMNEARMKQ